MMRLAVLPAAALAALSATLAVAAEDAAPERPITKVLPQVRKHKICFSARFADGVAVTQSDTRLRSLTASLYWDEILRTDYGDGIVGRDRHYELMLMAELDGRTVFGGVECPFIRRALINPKPGATIEDASTTALHCYRDCSESSLTFEADGKALVVMFGEHGVRFSGEGGEYLKPVPVATRLRLEPAPAAACRPIAKYERN